MAVECRMLAHYPHAYMDMWMVEHDFTLTKRLLVKVSLAEQHEAIEFLGIVVYLHYIHYAIINL